jgi:iron complex transport system permease protein
VTATIHGPRVFAIERGPFTRRIRLRGVVATVAIVLLALCLGILAVCLGDFFVAPSDVIAALVGVGTPKNTLVVVEWRLPRVLLALVFGAALGAAGAIFQSLTRNPLGSPDIIGFDAGAYTGALLIMTAGASGFVSTAIGSFLGGLAAAVIVYLLAWRGGFQGFRLIIVGIGVSAMLASVNTWLILNADLYVAMMASAWGMGSLNGLGWEQVGPSLLFLAPLAVACAVLADRMHLLELGDDTATALGVRTGVVRILLVLVGVGLTAVVIALCGPIAFIALAAPQIGRRITGSAGVTLTGSAAVGAALLVGSDVIAQRLFAPTQLPVGLVTVALGGGYLVWLLIHEARKA